MIKGHIRRTFRKAGVFLRKNAGIIIPMGAMMALGAGEAFAWSTPSSGSFAYDVYDIGINKVAKGAIGYVVGAGLLAGGIFFASRSAWVPAITMIIGSGVLIKLDSIATSLGYVV